MRNRLLVAGVLVVLILAAVALQMRSAERVESLASRELLSVEQLEQLAALEGISISRGELKVELARLDGNWGVLSHAGYPAQRERLAALLHALHGARVLEEKTANPDHHARLGLDTGNADSQALQVLLHASGEDFGIVYGNPVGNGQLVRFVDQDQVLLINRTLATSVNPNDWLALRAVNIPMQAIARARWEHADGETLELAKQAEDDYNLKLADQPEQGGNERWINGLVLALANFTAQNVALREELDLPAPSLKMQIETWAGSRLQASLYDLDGRYWLLIDGFDQAEEDAELDVNADPRWAYQIGIGQMEDLSRRRNELLAGP